MLNPCCLQGRRKLGVWGGGGGGAGGGGLELEAKDTKKN